MNAPDRGLRIRVAPIWCAALVYLAVTCSGCTQGSSNRDLKAPPVPKDLVAFARGGHSIQLLWHPSIEMSGTGTAGYLVFRDRDAAPIATVSTAQYTDRAVDPDTEHSYRVRAFDGANNRSEMSDLASARTPSADATAPSMPDRPSVWGANGTATVSWAAAWDGGSAIQSYLIGGADRKIITTVPAGARSVDLTHLDPGHSYRFAIAARNAMGDSEWSDQSDQVTPAPINFAHFPVQYSTNRRYLVDQAGTPFPILGRTAWFILAVSEDDQWHFLNDTLAKGHNAIELYALTHDRRGLNPPRNGQGELPFVRTLSGEAWRGQMNPERFPAEAPDMTTPNEAYWARLDRLLEFCESHGVLVFLFPGYAGYEGGEQGWMQEMVANGRTRMQTYGAWFAQRYAERTNIVWMMGGDMGIFNRRQLDAAASMLAGMRSVQSQRSVHVSAEWQSETIGTDQPDFGRFMTLNSVYSWTGKVIKHGHRAYAYEPTIPSFLLEEPYDQEGPDGTGVNPNALQPVRRFQWQGWLTTIGGYISGNGYVWPFSDPRWSGHLHTPGASDMALLNRFIRSIRWWDLAPMSLEARKDIGPQAPPGKLEEVVAARTEDRKLLVAYVPPSFRGTVQVPPGMLTGRLRAEWINPSNGTTVSIGEFDGNARLVVRPPGDNGSGFADWILVARDLDSP